MDYKLSRDHIPPALQAQLESLLGPKLDNILTTLESNPQILPLAAAGLLSALLALFLLLPRSSLPPGKKLGISHSNLSDEDTYDADGLPDWRIKSLWIYPIKSCQGVELNKVRLIPTGFENDRQFTFGELREKGWVFITQRQYPKLTTVGAEIYEAATGSTLRATFGKQAFTIPLDATGPETPITIWKETPTAYDVSGPLTAQLAALGKYLGAKHPLGLFRAIPGSPRPVFRNAPTVDELGYQPVVGFADAYPLHLLNLHSIRELAARIPSMAELSARRFRANIIVTGPPAFDEDMWRRITLASEPFVAACRTVRCKMPNINQDSAERNRLEPDATMRSYRAIDSGAPGGACMGLQLVAGRETGTMEVNEVVEVQERGDSVYINQ